MNTSSSSMRSEKSSSGETPMDVRSTNVGWDALEFGDSGRGGAGILLSLHWMVVSYGSPGLPRYLGIVRKNLPSLYLMDGYSSVNPSLEIEPSRAMISIDAPWAHSIVMIVAPPTPLRDFSVTRWRL